MSGSRFSGVEWRRRGMCYAVLDCICGTRWHSTENQIRALQQLPVVLDWWCIRGPSFSEMTEQQSPRQQKDPHARKCSFFFPLSFTAYWRQYIYKKEKLKQGKKDESSPTHFKKCSHILGFQWEDWAITAISQMLCLDPCLHLSFPKAV